jgi:hypothetical protein
MRRKKKNYFELVNDKGTELFGKQNFLLNIEIFFIEMERQKKKTPFSGKQTPMNWRCI